jgi:hypothetical protein
MYKIEFSNEENGYIMTCKETGLKEFITEQEFCDMVDSGKLQVAGFEDEDESDELCDCPFCQGVRTGVEMVLSDMEDECDCPECRAERIDEDIFDELQHLKEDMVAYRECGDYEEYNRIVDAYVKLIALVTDEEEEIIIESEEDDDSFNVRKFVEDLYRKTGMKSL